MTEEEVYLDLKHGLEEILTFTRDEYVHQFDYLLNNYSRKSIRYKIALKVININYDLALKDRILSKHKPTELTKYLESGLVSYIDKRGSYYCYKLNKEKGVN